MPPPDLVCLGASRTLATMAGKKPAKETAAKKPPASSGTRPTGRRLVGGSAAMSAPREEERDQSFALTSHVLT